jgi:hypothetical protein
MRQRGNYLEGPGPRRIASVRVDLAHRDTARRQDRPWKIHATATKWSFEASILFSDLTRRDGASNFKQDLRRRDMNTSRMGMAARETFGAFCAASFAVVADPCLCRSFIVAARAAPFDSVGEL